MINIYHYSDRYFSGYIKPDFFGLNSYTDNSKKLSGVKRSFFYIDKKSREYYLAGCKYCYISKVDKNKIYNLDIDNLGIVKNLKLHKDIHIEIKRRGYIGISGNNGFNCIILFKAIKINKRLNLTK
jgi:hypothetical protein